MNKLNRTSTIVLAIALTGLETFSAFAGTMPASLSMPQPIPPRFVAEAPSGLLKLFDDTSEWGADLTMRISIHDSRCSSIDPADSILLADCTRSRTLLEGEKKRYAQSLERYQRATAIFEKISDRRTLVRALDREEIELDRRLEGLRTEFSRSNERFKGYLQAIDAWLGNSAKAQGGALQQARSFLLGTVMDGIHARNKALTEKAREKLARLKSSYRSTGGGKTLRKATRKIEKIHGSLSREGAVLDLAKELKRQHDIIGIADVAGGNHEEQLGGVLELLTLFEMSPTAKLLVGDLRLAEKVSYGWMVALHTRERVEQLLKVSEQDYRTLTRQSEDYVQLVDGRIRVKNEVEQHGTAIVELEREIGRVLEDVPDS